MTISKIKIFIPVPTGHSTTSMYLPLFIAKEKGIVNDVIMNIIDKEVEVVIESSQTPGDFEAISAMSNCKEQGTLALAIADPTGLQDNLQAIVVGALVSKLSFWAIANEMKDNLSRYERLVYYDEKLKTGSMIGKLLRKRLNIVAENEFRVSRIGDEMNHLDDPKKLIITPDLLSVAAKHVKGNAFRIVNFSMKDRKSEITDDDVLIDIDDEYITTAIFAKKMDVVDKDRAKLIRAIIMSFQKAKFVLYSSKQIATETFKEMGCIKELTKSGQYSEKNISDIVEYVIERMQIEKIYPYDTNISKKQWEKTVKEKDLDYYKFVNNKIVYEAEKELAKELGVSYKNYVPKFIVSIIHYLKRNWRAVVIALVVMSVLILMNIFNVIGLIITDIGTICSIIGVVVYSLLKK